MVIARKPRPRGDEAQRMARIVQWHDLLLDRETFLFHIPNEGRRGWRTQRTLKASGVKAGVADLCLMASGGRTLWLEVKGHGGKSTPHQQAFGEACEALGHRYFVVRSVEDVRVAMSLCSVSCNEGLAARIAREIDAQLVACDNPPSR